MNDDIYDVDKRASLVAKDILAASKLVNHPNFTYKPSKQLRNLMSDEEIATTLVHLNRIHAMSMDTRGMYLGDHIQSYPGYAIQTYGHSLTNIANPIDIDKLLAENDDKAESIEYKSKDRLLIVGNKKLPIRGDMLANLCNTILNSTDKSKVWSNDEVFEAWGWAEDRIFDDNFAVKKENRLKIYQKAKVLNDRVAVLTEGRIKNLFDYSTKSISINEAVRKNVS